MSLKYCLDFGIYELDVLYAGGKVEYTGEVIYKGFGYSVEKAIISLGGFELVGYMKRFKRGNAVYCLYSSKGLEFTKQEWKAKYEIKKILSDKELHDVDFYEFHAVRDVLIFLTSLVSIGTIIMSIYCFNQWMSDFESSRLYMIFVCVGAFILMLNMRGVCKSLEMKNYKAKLFRQEDLEKFRRMYDDEEKDQE